MKSGLEGRNNAPEYDKQVAEFEVSMKSGLEGRNNQRQQLSLRTNWSLVSMKSGLEGRNNYWSRYTKAKAAIESQ